MQNQKWTKINPGTQKKKKKKKQRAKIRLLAGNRVNIRY
jgi:hypothetical protein